MTIYTYTLSSTASGEADLPLLNSEVDAAIAGVDALSSYGGASATELLIYSQIVLDAGEITTLDGVIAAHAGEFAAVPSS